MYFLYSKSYCFTHIQNINIKISRYYFEQRQITHISDYHKNLTTPSRMFLYNPILSQYFKQTSFFLAFFVEVLHETYAKKSFPIHCSTFTRCCCKSNENCSSYIAAVKLNFSNCNCSRKERQAQQQASCRLSQNAIITQKFVSQWRQIVQL